MRLGPRHDHLRLRERGPLLGQAVGTEQATCDREELVCGQLAGLDSADKSVKLALAETVLGGPGPPVLS